MADGPTAIANWATLNEAWLKKHLKLPNGIPGKDTFRRVLSLLNPAAFQQCFQQWLHSLSVSAADASDGILSDYRSDLPSWAGGIERAKNDWGGSSRLRTQRRRKVGYTLLLKQSASQRQAIFQRRSQPLDHREHFTLVSRHDLSGRREQSPQPHIRRQLILATTHDIELDQATPRQTKQHYEAPYGRLEHRFPDANHYWKRNLVCAGPGV